MRILNKYLIHRTLIELFRTITPALVLIAIAFPSISTSVSKLLSGGVDISDLPGESICSSPGGGLRRPSHSRNKFNP